MATATTRSDLHLPALTSFLTLAPTTSAGIPTHQRTLSSPAVVSDSQHSQKLGESTSTAEVPVVAEKVVVTETVTAAPVVPTISAGKETDTELKFRRSSSLSSDGSLKTFRFLRLGPVHHGERDGDWSEEVAVAE